MRACRRESGLCRLPGNGLFCIPVYVKNGRTTHKKTGRHFSKGKWSKGGFLRVARSPRSEKIRRFMSEHEGLLRVTVFLSCTIGFALSCLLYILYYSFSFYLCSINKKEDNLYKYRYI
jgi:hypothetical protein